MTTAHPHGPGDITETVWSAPRSSIDLDWYRMVEKFGFDWMKELATLLSL